LRFIPVTRPRLDSTTINQHHLSIIKKEGEKRIKKDWVEDKSVD